MVVENEQQTKKEKTGKIRRIFKWLGKGILALLLILALIFQVPWKIITLLAIFFLACFVLPQRMRKWFWFSAAGVVTVLIIWIFMPEDNKGWRPYRYNIDKELEILEAKHSIPDEQNAAIIYNQLLESHDPNDYYIFDSDPNTFAGISQNPWLSKDYPEIADGLKHLQSEIETLIEISKIEQCVFPLSDPVNPESQIDRNAAIRRWVRLLVIAINNDIAEGRNDKATKKIVANLQMAKHLYQQPTRIDFLIGIYVEKLTFMYLNRIVIEKEALDTHLIIIEKALPDINNDWNSIFTKAIEYDKLCTKIELTIYYEINTKGRTRLSRDPLAQLRSNLSEFLQDTEIDNDQTKAKLEYIAYLSYLRKKLIKAETIFRWFTMPSDPEKAAEILDTCFDNYDFMAKPDFDWKKQPQEPDSFNTWSYFYRLMFYSMHIEQLIADKGAESNYRLYDSYLRMLTLRRGSRLLLAIKQYYNQHGHWPESLEAIKSAVPAEAFVDPVTGNQLQYENHGERFSLYSEAINIWPR